MSEAPPVPFKLRVLRALTAALKEITPANGYQHDLADFTAADGVEQERVFRGRSEFGDNDPIPMISILEGVGPADELTESSQDTSAGEYDWPILIQGFLEDDPVHPSDPAYPLLADVRRRLAVEKVRKPVGGHQPDPFGLGGGRNRITRVSIGSGVVRPADQISARTYFWLTLTLRVVDNAAEPFS